MGEGVAAADGVVIDGATYDDPGREPAPDPQRAPKGWTWSRRDRRWIPRQRVKGGDSNSGSNGPETSPGDERPSDPDPAWMRDGKDSGGKAPPLVVTQDVKDNVGGVLGVAGLVVLPAAQRLDPACGGALVDNYENIVNACVPLLCRSETVVRWMTAEKGGLLEWLALGKAVAPVAKVFAQHHIFKTITVAEDAETGDPVVVPTEDLAQYTTVPDGEG
jgi:hypothetical protein